MAKTKRELNQKTAVLTMRMSPMEAEEWRDAAFESRRSLSQWVRDCCNAVTAK